MLRIGRIPIAGQILRWGCAHSLPSKWRDQQCVQPTMHDQRWKWRDQRSATIDGSGATNDARPTMRATNDARDQRKHLRSGGRPVARDEPAGWPKLELNVSSVWDKNCVISVRESPNCVQNVEGFEDSRATGRCGLVGCPPPNEMGPCGTAPEPLLTKWDLVARLLTKSDLVACHKVTFH